VQFFAYCKNNGKTLVSAYTKRHILNNVLLNTLLWKYAGMSG
jgi:hypothetical protein